MVLMLLMENWYKPAVCIVMHNPPVDDYWCSTGNEVESDDDDDDQDTIDYIDSDDGASQSKKVRW